MSKNKIVHTCSLIVAALSLAFVVRRSARAAEPYAVRVDALDKIATCPLYPAGKPLALQIYAGDSLRVSYAIPTAIYKEEDISYHVQVRVRSPKGEKTILDETLSPKWNLKDRGWLSKILPLEEFKGEKAEILFSSSRLTKQNTASALPGPAEWGGIRVGNFVRKPGEFNIILISLDTLRADRLGAAGYKRRDTTPELDALAKEGVYFPRAVAQASWTKPSHMSLFTSVYPSVHRIESDWGTPGVGHRVSNRFPMLTEMIKNNGYLTHAFTGSAHVSARIGFDRGFDEFDEFTLLNHEDGVPVFHGAHDWLSDHAKDKFFLFLHTYEIHSPYRHHTFVKPHMKQEEEEDAAYDSGVRYVSGLVGGLVDDLKKLGIYDDTLIIVFSDHGESLGNHGLEGHANSLYDELVTVPLIFSLPKRFVPRKLDDLNVELVDVFPTVCDLLGVPRPAGLMGQSLKPLLLGKDRPAESWGMSEITYSPKVGGQKTKRHFEGKIPNSDDEKAAGHRRLTSVRYSGSGRYKLIYGPSFVDHTEHRRFDIDDRGWILNRDAGGRQLFDLAKDPEEKKNIGAKNPTLVERLRQKFVNRVSSGPKPATRSESGKGVPIDSAMKDQLRALGY